MGIGYFLFVAVLEKAYAGFQNCTHFGVNNRILENEELAEY
jgi:hypothetical protein